MDSIKEKNIIPCIRRFVTNELGENYWLHGCLRYVMEALGESDFDYEFFAGFTGDIFTQVYSFDRFRGDCATDYLLSGGEHGFIEDIFARCGYESEFVPQERVKAESRAYLQKILDYIDRGVPVISNLDISGHKQWLVMVGYEDRGETLLFMTDNMTAPEKVTSAEVFAPSAEEAGWSRGLVFVGEKRGRADLPGLYRRAIEGLPALMRTRRPEYCFGPAAFHAWADDIEGGRYDMLDPEEFERDKWYLYTNYICILATNGSCCHEFLDRAQRLNPDMAWLSELHRLYGRMAYIWEKEPEGLEAMGAGFNITLEVLRDREKRNMAAAKLREYAALEGQVLDILERELRRP